MLPTILLALLWLLIITHTTGSFMTLCNAFRYRDVMMSLDADRIAHQPFQPKISVIVRCNPESCNRPIEKIQELLALNYSQYEVIVILDSDRNPEALAGILDFFELKPLPIPEALEKLRYPTRGFYRSKTYKRLLVLDKTFRPDDDLRYTGAAVCRADYMLFVRSLDNKLTRNSLANLAIMKMRSPEQHISSIRGVARYECQGKIKKTFFLMLTELCNLRRIYVAGKFRNNDYGQFVILEDISGIKGSEEVVPKTQMYLHRPNRFYTYLESLAPHIRYRTRTGKLISFMEFLITLEFWGAGIHMLFSPGVINADFMFLLSALMLPLLGSTYSILIGEIFLKKDVQIGFTIRLLLLSIVESLLFCLFHPWVWIINQLNKRKLH